MTTMDLRKHLDAIEAAHGVLPVYVPEDSILAEWVSQGIVPYVDVLNGEDADPPQPEGTKVLCVKIGRPDH